MATGPTTVADNWVNTALSNPTHPVDGAGGQVNTSFYVIGGLVGEVGTTLHDLRRGDRRPGSRCPTT